MEADRLEKLCLPPPPTGRAPWLVYQHDDDERKMQTFITPWLKNKSYLKAIPELQGKFVLASCHGWLLLDDIFSIESISLWNPMTLETISLPPLENVFDLDWKPLTCVLTSSPDEDDDFAVLVFCDHFAFSHRPKSDHEPRWRVDGIEIEGKPASISEAIACNSVIYAWATTTTTTEDGDDLREGFFVTMKVNVNNDDDNESSSSVILTPLELDKPNSNSTCGYSQLLESCGRVYEVWIGFRHCLDPQITGVEVSELDLEKKTWVAVKSLDGRAFFLGRIGCVTWCWTSAGGTASGVEGNSVYFLPPSFDDGAENTLLQYKLDNRSIKTYVPCPNTLRPWGSPFWFIPQFPRSLPRRLAKPSTDKVYVVNEEANIVVNSEGLPKQNETTANVFNRLPLDIIALVSKYLHWFDYLEFRTTCKSLRSALPPGRCQWSRHYDSSLPFFASLTNDDGLFKIVDLFRHDSRSIMIPKSPKGAFCIDFCKGGWLILYSGGESFHFFNLFTRVRGDFPPLKCTPYFMSVGFSTCPVSSDCVTVGMYEFDLLTIWYFRSGDQDWEYAEFKCDKEEFSPSTCAPVYHSGGFYFLDTRGRVGVFELEGGKATWQVYGRPRMRDVLFHSLHLVECDGQLFSVFIGKPVKWMQVFRFNDLKKSWVRVKSLGNNIFFISRASSVSTPARAVGMGNRIYLPRLHDNRFIFYSLETRKYHVLGTQVSMDDFFPSEKPLECCWV